MRIEKKHSKMVISFSGGKTSARMMSRLISEFRHGWEEVVVVFANTGEEHQKTLEYVDACDKHWGAEVVWLEAQIDPRYRKATGHRIVDFKTATRGGRLFDEMSTKYGIPNQQFPHCTRELKLRPIESYLRSLGWSEYNTAVGIRYDEIDRMSPSAMDGGVFYPMIDWRETKQTVANWDKLNPFHLGIPEHLGNCTWCWKKSFRKLGTLYLEHPDIFSTPARLEAAFKDFGSGQGDRRLFRQRKTVADIVEMARDPKFVPFSDELFLEDPSLDTGMACGDGCEIGVDGPADFAA